MMRHGWDMPHSNVHCIWDMSYSKTLSLKTPQYWDASQKQGQEMCLKLRFFMRQITHHE